LAFSQRAPLHHIATPISIYRNLRRIAAPAMKQGLFRDQPRQQDAQTSYL
jgi:hypothetical protein